MSKIGYLDYREQMAGWYGDGSIIFQVVKSNCLRVVTYG